MEIGTGTIVKYNGRFYRITRETKNTVNLGGTFGYRVYHKGIEKSLVTEAEDEWYQRWTESETYRCM
jgi:hypothetical protein